MTRERIKDIPDGDLPFVVYEHFGTMPSGNPEVSERDFVAQLSAKQQAFYGLFVIRERVNPGGFIDFFRHEPLDFLEYAIVGCDMMHEDELKSIFEGALRHMQQNKEDFVDLDAAFFQCTQGAYILKVLVHLVREHWRDFVDEV